MATNPKNMDELSLGSTSAGFKLLRIDDIVDVQSTGYLLEHQQSKCLVYHIANQNPENVFCFAFKTPPGDSSGVAHIIEHTVLSGSEKYPTKDPFMELIKGSVQTFLNAMTYPDKTIYPAASVVEQDFFNLLAVYADAVFCPLLRKESFQQEGHHLEFNPEGNLERVGVVYNEMKGVYSAAESTIEEWSYRSLFPDHIYSNDSGGSPEDIAKLSYEQFLEFHKSYYHPSNCKILLFGSLDLEKTLEFLDREYLRKFTAATRADTRIPLMKRWEQAQDLSKYYPADKNSDSGSTLMLSWLLPATSDPYLNLALVVLSDALIAYPGSPLEKLLLESGLGEDISPVTGLELHLQEACFTIGLRGCKPAKNEEEKAELRQKFKDLVFRKLQELEEQGLDRELILGVITSIEFNNREIKGGSPFGLKLINRVIRSWNYGGDPGASLSFNKHIAYIQEQGPEFFSQLIKKHLLENKHHALILVEPDTRMLEDKDRIERTELQELQESLGAQAKQELIRDSQQLKILQNELPPKGLLPRLKRSEIPQQARIIESSSKSISSSKHKAEILEYDIFSNGISYLDLSFDLQSFSFEELFYLPLFANATPELGLADMGYEEVAKNLALQVGGFNISLHSFTPIDKQQPELECIVNSKYLPRQVEPGSLLVERLLREGDWSDHAHIRDILKNMKNSIQAAIIPSATNHAINKAVEKISKSKYIGQTWYGLKQLHFLQRLIEKDDMPSLQTKMQAIRQKVLGSLRTINIVGLAADRAKTLAIWTTLLEDYKTSPQRPVRIELPQNPSSIEAVSLASQVSYLGVAIPGCHYTDPLHPALTALAAILRTGYLWEKIRMEGGAYGASATNSSLEKFFTFSSYRDPQADKSLGVFKDSLHNIIKNFHNEELEMAIISLGGWELHPLSPLEQGRVAMNRYVLAITKEIRQTWRDRLLSLEKAQIHAAASYLLDNWSQKKVCVFSNENAVKKFNPDIINNI